MKKRVFIAGSNGMVGSSIVRKLKNNLNYELVLRNRKELDLLSQSVVNEFFEKENIDIVILAAARVGGIKANIDHPGKFLYENLQIQNNVIHASYLYNVKKMIFLGSSCIYPKNSQQPMKEEYLLTGKLEPTNEGYALAKIAGLKLCEFYKKEYSFNSLSIMPCNLYGPNDSFDLAHSHVLSALVKRFCDAVVSNLNEVVLWGTGEARREFMHVDDLSDAVVFFMEGHTEEEMLNIGSGVDLSIKELAEIIANKVGYKGEITWDISKADGMMKKCLDVSKMKSLGFTPKISLNSGIEQMIEIYKQFKN